jgi:hypothetical protein
VEHFKLKQSEEYGTEKENKIFGQQNEHLSRGKTRPNLQRYCAAEEEKEKYMQRRMKQLSSKIQPLFVFETT